MSPVRVGIDDPLLPDYRGACIANVVPALLGAVSPPDWVPAVASAPHVVLLVLDGLGWELLQERRHIAPTLAAMVGQAITSVAPTTTSAALTSITTGCPPGEHAMVGYRLRVGGETLNTLAWTTPTGPAIRRVPPREFQPVTPFLDQRPTVVNKAEFVRTGFTEAHLRDVRYVGYSTPTSQVFEVEQAVKAGERFVYTYYDGLDKVGHHYGFGTVFDRELAACDRLVAELLAVLPADAALLVTADHGQVHSADDISELPDELTRHVAAYSGEDRFRWLHAAPGHDAALLKTAQELFGHRAWVRSLDQAIEQGWFGARVSSDARARYGDVVLAAKGTAAFISPDDPGSMRLIGRHGSLTSAEMLVPLLGALGVG